MKKKFRKNIYVTLALFLLFVLWTLAIKLIDVQSIGPNGSEVGFAALNGFIHDVTGVHMELYIITDWLGLVPVFVAFGFAVLGLVQLIKRRSFLKVDYSILVLGGFYILVISAYILFEMLAVNYRPVLIDGYLEASYPSSTTLLVMCVMPTSVMQLHTRIKNKNIRNIIFVVIYVFTAFMVIGRFISGVHWLTDIVGGIILSAGLVMLYYSVSSLDIKIKE